MKIRVALPLLFAAVHLAAAVQVFGEGSNRAQRSRRASVLPEDIANCVQYTRSFYDRPLLPEKAIEAIVDHCALKLRPDDKNYPCVHLQEGLTNAFQHEPSDKALTPEAFCQVSEAYMIALRGATRVANVGTGPLINFHLSPQCNPMVASSLQHNSSTMAASEVPELWYSICMNSDCGSFLPSRTRWCSLTHKPTHSVTVCEAARKSVQKGVTALGNVNLNAAQICGLFADFVQEMGHDVEAYEHVVHAVNSPVVPVPEDPVRALQSSQIVNVADSHYLRDNAGVAPATHSHAAARSCRGLCAVVVAFVVVLVFVES